VFNRRFTIRDRDNRTTRRVLDGVGAFRDVLVGEFGLSLSDDDLAKIAAAMESHRADEAVLPVPKGRFLAVVGLRGTATVKGPAWRCCARSPPLALTPGQPRPRLYRQTAFAAAPICGHHRGARLVVMRSP